ncbi:MAG: MBL fold metallo-hydrolase [Treponema sp.]|nr:MBL fold metallo-hydrolase [Treponema sp.]
MQSKYSITQKDYDAYMDIFKYPYKFAVHPFKIFGNLYYVGNKAVSSHLIDTGSGLILIDTTFPHTWPFLINSVWEAGFSLYDIKYILHSHGHFDHFGGTKAIAALTGAKTFLSAADARMLEERPELSLGMDIPFCNFELFTPDEEMEDGQIITLGGTQVRAVLTPGHTPGVVSFFVNVTDGDKTYTAAMQGGAGLNTLNIDFLRKFDLDAAEARKGFLEGLDKLEKEKADIPLGNHPSHNKTLEKRKKMIENPEAENPFIDPDEWQVFLTRIRKEFETMLAKEAGGE